MGLYGVRREQIPAESQYGAGPRAQAQTIRSSPRIDYCGSLMQLDFGEREQDKFVNLVKYILLPAAVVTRSCRLLRAADDRRRLRPARRAAQRADAVPPTMPGCASS
jgi:hypothetical protein